MPADRIEREIDIEAPIDVVWAVITEAEHITGWFTDSAELEVRPGGEGRFGWNDKAANRETVVNLRVERVDPPHFFSFRWGYPNAAKPEEANAPLVEFTLESRGESTHLRLVESGLNAVDRSETARDEYFADHTSGWDQIVARLQVYAAEQRNAIAG
jgi:uncharacterized protein YndB with AHSA1/START domain